MGEFGCLGDESFQNLAVQGKTKIGGTIEVIGHSNVDTVTAKGNVLIGGNLATTAITVAADDDVTLTKGDVDLTEGNVNLTKGDVNLTEGNVTLSDGNLTVAGTLLGAPYLPALVTIPHALLAGNSQTLTAGVAGANQVNLPSGSILLLQWTGEGGNARSINLPFATKGYSFLLIIGNNIIGAAKLTIDVPDAGTKIAQGSFLHTNHLNSNPDDRIINDAAGKDKIEIKGNANNGICGGSSTFRFHCLEANKWFVMAECQADGTGVAGELQFV